LSALHSEWNKDAAPLDGTAIVAVGRVIWEDEFSTSCESFVAEVRWTNPCGQAGWHHTNGLAVARTLEDVVIIDYWMPYPGGQR
jgi:hypothetical protein